MEIPSGQCSDIDAAGGQNAGRVQTTQTRSFPLLSPFVVSVRIMRRGETASNVVRNMIPIRVRLKKVVNMVARVATHFRALSLASLELMLNNC